MKKDLIIQSIPQGLDIALLEDDKLVEYYQDVANQDYVIGDVYFGEVKKILTGLNAAFIDIGYEKNAFLHYHDLGPHFKNFSSFIRNTLNTKNPSSNISNYTSQGSIPKNGDISSVLKVGQPVVVQLAKEPISTKGHRVTTQITLAGRFLILIPFSHNVSISKRIRDRGERKRLSTIIDQFKIPNFGIIGRTVAESVQSQLIEEDINRLKIRWEEIASNLFNKKQKLLGEFSKSTSILRDMVNESFHSIIVDNKDVFNELQAYIEQIIPDKKKILKLSKDKAPLFQVYSIDKQLKSSFGKIVNFGKGAYLVIEPTEAMCVIDVNSGSKNTKDAKSREETVLKVNLEAAEEVVRQLRLRDIGGIIVIDFIDMKLGENQRILFDKMKQLLRNDPTQSSVLPISKFGLMEVTRHRVKPAIDLAISESCPVCKGTGQLKPTILVIDDIEHSINYIASELKEKYVELKVHPFVKYYLASGLFSKRVKWMLKYKMRIKITPSESYHLIQYKLLDKNSRDLEEF